MKASRAEHILRDISGGGYPIEYLIARLKGRKSAFVRHWEDVISSGDPLGYLFPIGNTAVDRTYEGIRRRLETEYDWIYRQMNGDLRKIFAPYFAYIELKTIIVCLRFSHAGERQENIERALAVSLLSDNIRDALREAEFASALKGVAAGMAAVNDAFAQIADAPIAQGLMDLERMITKQYLEHVIGSSLHAVVRGFFTYIIDVRNIILLHKNVRWGIEGTPSLMNGGSIPVADIEKNLAEDPIEAVASCIRRITGSHVAIERYAHLENILLSGLSDRLVALEKRYPEEGFILKYLWQCYSQTRNFTVIFYGNRENKDALREEVVR